MSNQADTIAVTVSDENFDAEVLQSDVPVLVDFWAEWCGPCKAVGPALESLASDYEGKIKVAKLNVDDNANTAARYGVRSIPTMIVFKEGEAQQTSVGARPKSQLVSLVEQFVE